MHDVTLHNKSFAVGLAGLMLSVCPLSSMADEFMDAALSEEDFLAELPVVLSATRLSQPLDDVPVAMTVIDRETIEALGATTIPDVLRLVPGFQVGRVTGSKMTVTYHGKSDRYARNLQVLVDGRSVYDAGFGGVTWSDLPVLLEDIQRIEVIRGPNSAAFGANAFNATINIITIHPAEQSGTLGKITAGSLSTRRLVVRHAASLQDFDFRLTLMTDESRGLETRYDDSQTEMVSFRGDYHLDATSGLLFEAGFSKAKRDDGFGSFFDDPDFDLYQPERTIDHYKEFQQLRWSKTLSAENEWSLQFYHNYQEIEDNFETVLFSEYLNSVGLPYLLPWPDQRLKLGYGLSSERTDLELQHIARLSPDWRVVWGVGARLDAAWGVSMFGNNDVVERSQLRAFLNTEWYAKPSIVFNAGLMAEAYEGYQPYYSPRLAVNFHVDPLQTLRLSYSRAIRMPTLVENHSFLRARFQDETTFDVFEINEKRLKPEEIESYEVGYVGYIPQHKVVLDLKFYRDEIRNHIGVPFDKNCKEPAAICTNPVVGSEVEGAFLYSDSGDLSISGFEVGVSAKPTRNTLLRAAYAYAKTSGELIRRINESGTLPPYDYYEIVPDLAPKHTYSLLLAHHFPQQIDASVAYYRLDSMRWLGEGDSVAGYDKVDVKFSHTARYGGGAEGKISLILKNIGNHYTDFQRANKIGPESYIEFELFFD